MLQAGEAASRRKVVKGEARIKSIKHLPFSLGIFSHLAFSSRMGLMFSHFYILQPRSIIIIIDHHHHNAAQCHHNVAAFFRASSSHNAIHEAQFAFFFLCFFCHSTLSFLFFSFRVFYHQYLMLNTPNPE